MASLGARARLAGGWIPPDDWRRETLDRDERVRLLESAMIALAAEGCPRRLGADASRADLARDKRVARRVANVYVNVLRFYGAGVGDLRVMRAKAMDERWRVRGSQVRWNDWITERLIWLPQQAARLAVYAIQSNQFMWGNRIVFQLDRERELLERVRRLP